MPGEGSPESDIGPMTRNGMAWAWLGHDGTHYFDLHHNAEDTLDKIDPEALAQNVAAYPVFTWLAAQDRQSVVEGKSVLVRVDLGGRRIINKKKQETTNT